MKGCFTRLVCFQGCVVRVWRDATRTTACSRTSCSTSPPGTNIICSLSQISTLLSKQHGEIRKTHNVQDFQLFLQGLLLLSKEEMYQPTAKAVMCGVRQCHRGTGCLTSLLARCGTWTMQLPTKQLKKEQPRLPARISALTGSKGHRRSVHCATTDDNHISRWMKT